MAITAEGTPSNPTMPPTPTTRDGKEDSEHNTLSNIASMQTRPSHSHFRLWYALTVFSAVSLIALSTETATKEWQVEEKWVLSVSLISMVLGSLASLAHIRFPEDFSGMPLEGIMLFTQLGLWVGGMIVMMDTNNLIAVNRYGEILNPNLFFFGWSSLVITIVLLFEYLKQVERSTITLIPNIGYWVGIFLASLVVLLSSLQILVSEFGDLNFICQDQDGDNGSGFCERLKFSIALGVTSLFISGASCLRSFKISTTANGSVSFLMLFIWSIGVALITFGDKSPGNEVGNLYFGCWIAFVFSFFMVSSIIKDALTAREAAPSNQNGNQGKETAPSISSLDSKTEKNEPVNNMSGPQAVEQAEKDMDGPKTPATISFAKQDLEAMSDEGTDPDTNDARWEPATPDV